MAGSVSPSLIVAEALRIDVEGSPSVEGAAFNTTGRSVAMLGAPRSMFEACAAMRPVTSGTLKVCDLPPKEAALRALAAGAPLDPALPPKWTVREYVRWNARLVGHDAARAARNAEGSLELLHVSREASLTLGTAPLHIKRAAVVAGAIATGAELIFLEDPTPGLTDDVARSLSRFIAQALDERAWVLFAGRLPLTSPFAHRTEEAFMYQNGTIIGGAPAELASAERSFRARVEGDAPRFTAALRERGGNVEGVAPELTIRLEGDLGTRDLFDLAAQNGAILTELVPVAPTFA
ncbi:hypothetical protein BH09MYX1_BH09MYX1_38480 [soil metagenome]